jgi:hypothetical protein
MGTPKQSSIRIIPRDSRRVLVDVVGAGIEGVSFGWVFERKECER